MSMLLASTLRYQKRVDLEAPASQQRPPKAHTFVTPCPTKDLFRSNVHLPPLVEGEGTLHRPSRQGESRAASDDSVCSSSHQPFREVGEPTSGLFRHLQVLPPATAEGTRDNLLRQPSDNVQSTTGQSPTHTTHSHPSPHEAAEGTVRVSTHKTSTQTLPTKATKRNNTGQAPKSNTAPPQKNLMLNKSHFVQPPKLVLPSSTAFKGYLINTNGLASSVIAKPNGDLSNLHRDKIATLANLAKNGILM